MAETCGRVASRRAAQLREPPESRLSSASNFVARCSALTKNGYSAEKCGFVKTSLRRTRQFKFQSREELVVERTPGSGQPVSGGIGRDQEIRVPLSEERVRVEKQPVVNEEVRVGKRQVQGSKQVSDQVRHEELRVDKEGEVNTDKIDTPRKRKNPAA